MTENDYDDLIYAILSGEGNIVDFFHKVFDFLYRRTDFFKIKGVYASNMGLEIGEAENIVKSVFCKYMETAISEQQNVGISEMEPVLSEYVAEEVVITTPASDLDCESKSDNKENINKINSQETLSKLVDEVEKNKYKMSSVIDTNCLTINQKEEKCAEVSTELKFLSEKEICYKANKKSPNALRNEDDQNDPKIPLMDAECYNGAKYEDYSWSQSLKDVDIRVKTPSYVRSKKQVHVKIEQTHLKVEFLKPDGEWIIGIDKDFTWPIIVAESTWTSFWEERYVFISLDKKQERWWDSVFSDDPKIDLKSIDPSIPFEDLDEESIAKINELMYDQVCKQNGKPSSQQKKMANIFKEAWDAEGSPFRGQPFDPTLIEVQQPTDSIKS